MNNEQLTTPAVTYRPTSVTAAPAAAHYSLFTIHYSLGLSVDPMSDKYPSTSPYAYCRNNPIVLVDPNGNKDKPFDAKKDKGISIQPRTETFITKTIGFGKVLSYSRKSQQNAYNCHSYAWHNSKGDQEAENPNTGKIEKQSRAYFRIPTTNDK